MLGAQAAECKLGDAMEFLQDETQLVRTQAHARPLTPPAAQSEAPSPSRLAVLMEMEMEMEKRKADNRSLGGRPPQEVSNIKFKFSLQRADGGSGGASGGRGGIRPSVPSGRVDGERKAPQAFAGAVAARRRASPAEPAQR